MVVLRGLRRYLALAPAERRLFVRAFIALGLTDLALRCFGFRRVAERAAQARPVGNRAVTLEELRRARRYARWIEAAARHHVIRAHCLQRSLVLHHWLQEEGLPSALHIGVRRADGALKAHAWVQVGGYVLNDRPVTVAAFTPLARANPGVRSAGR